MNYKDIELSSKQKNMLKKLKNKVLIDPNDKQRKICSTLCDLELLSCSKTYRDLGNGTFSLKDFRLEYKITDAGRMWLSYHRRAWWKELRAWLTLGISLAAFIKSFFF